MALEDAKKAVDEAFTRESSRGLAFENAFGGATSFLRRRYTKDLSGVDLAATGVPFDQAVTHRPGTRFGPRAIREASTLQTFDPPFGWDVNPMTDIDMVDYGDLAFDYAKTSAFPAALHAHIAGILAAGAGSLAFGGDHYVTYPILKAYAEVFGPISLVQFDAHTDTWPDDDYDRIDHGTMFYKAIKQGIIDPARSVQVGIRTVTPDEMGVAVITSHETRTLGPERVAEKVKEITKGSPVYLTFDIDALDPGFAPGTGTPVWGGLTSMDAQMMLQGLRGIDIKGGDVVEVSPPYDTTGATAIAGAHVAMEIACLFTHNRLSQP
ncbi:MAG: agmatinase [Pseudomonadota bacterium]